MNDVTMLVIAVMVIVAALCYSSWAGYCKGRADERAQLSKEERKLIEQKRWEADHRARGSDVGRHFTIIDQINGELAERNVVYLNARYNELAYGDPPAAVLTTSENREKSGSRET